MTDPTPTPPEPPAHELVEEPSEEWVRGYIAGRDAALASEGTPAPDLDDIEAFVYGMTIAFVEPEMARTFGRAVRERLEAPR